MKPGNKTKIRYNRQVALRYFATAFLPVWILGCLVLWLFFHSESKKGRQSLETNIAHTLDLQKKSIVLNFVSIISDLKFLSGMVEVRGLFDKPGLSVKEGLGEELAVFLKSKRIYDQARIINSSGKEIVRVEYNRGAPSIVLDDRLQDKSKRYYFRETFRIAPNALYVSPLDLNIEHGKVEMPYEPIIRLGTPLTDNHGDKSGIIVLNYFGEALIRNLNRMASDRIGDFMFLNRNGYWLKGRSLDEEWGFMFEGRQDRTFRHIFPDEWQRIGQEEEGQFLTPNGLFSFVTVHPFNGTKLSFGSNSAKYLFSDLLTEESYYWKLVSHVSPAILADSSRQTSNRFRFIFLVMTGSLLASYFFLVFAQYYRERNVDLELEKSKMEQILNYGEKIRTITNLNKLIDFIMEQASLILESQRCSLMLLDDDTGELCIRGAIGLQHNIIKESKLSLGEGIAGLVAKEGKPLLVEVIDEDKRIDKKSDPSYKSKSFLSVPIKLDHKLIGVVNVTDKKDKEHPTYTELDLKILLAIVRQAAVAIENAQLSKELKYLTITDPLTHLFNYRHLMECLAYEVKRLKRFDGPLCLLIIDVDDFKEYNDTYGHAEGNMLLKKIGTILMRGLREVDIICRYAGDEFVIILPDTDIAEARLIAEKVRSTVEKLEFKKPMTVSMGIAKGFKGMNRHDLILKADSSLHKAKKDGKNRIFCQGK